MEGVLTSVKKVLGIAEDYDHFDQDLVIHINTVFGILTQLGVGPENGFFITGSSETWNQFLTNPVLLEMVKTYVCLKVRLIFDPPISSSMTDMFNKIANELEWRINVTVDPGCY